MNSQSKFWMLNTTRGICCWKESTISDSLYSLFIPSNTYSAPVLYEVFPKRVFTFLPHSVHVTTDGCGYIDVLLHSVEQETAGKQKENRERDREARQIVCRNEVFTQNNYGCISLVDLSID